MMPWPDPVTPGPPLPIYDDSLSDPPMCRVHEARLDALEAGVASLAEVLARIEAKIDTRPDSDTIGELLTSGRWAGSGIGEVTAVCERLGSQGISAGRDVAVSWTGAVLALALLVGAVAASGMALQYGDLVIGAVSAAVENEAADTVD